MESIENEIQNMAGYDLKKLIDNGLVSRKSAIKWIVKTKYFQMAKTGKKYVDIKNELSDEYLISVRTIEKLIYNK